MRSLPRPSFFFIPHAFVAVNGSILKGTNHSANLSLQYNNKTVFCKSIKAYFIGFLPFISWICRKKIYIVTIYLSIPSDDSAVITTNYFQNYQKILIEIFGSFNYFSYLCNEVTLVERKRYLCSIKPKNITI